MTRCAALGLAWVATALSAAALAAADDPMVAERFRRPTALVMTPDGKTLFVANRKSGTISVVDTVENAPVAEIAVGKQLADLQANPACTRLVAVDDAAHELILLAVDGNRPRVLQRVKTAPYPVNATFALDGRQVFVASLWSRQVTRLDISDNESTPPGEPLTLDLPFPPRELLVLPGMDRLVVADAFGGRLAVVYTPRMKLLLTHDIPAHNIRGLRLTADRQRLVMIHQMLNEKAQSIQSDVHWGLLMSNDLRWISLDKVLYKNTDPKPDEMALYRGGHMHPLGEPGRGGGDPTALDIAPDGTLIVALGGTGDILYGKEDDFSMKRLRSSGPGSYEYSGDEYYGRKRTPPQRRPMDIKFSLDGRRAYTADMFSDSVTVIDIAEDKLHLIYLGRQPKELTEVERGEMLFYNARLSHDGWMSCHSCHPDGHTNGQLNDNQSDGHFGSSKRVLSLLGVRDTAPYAWSGGVDTLKDQTRNSLVKTMQGREEPDERDVDAITAFMMSLAAPPPVDDLRGRKPDAAAVERGKQVFAAHDCARCHAGGSFTARGAFDVGLVDEVGGRKFNPPSLRGVAQRGPHYFHDNRAGSLEEVFRKFGHPDGKPLTAEETDDLLLYLQSL